MEPQGTIVFSTVGRSYYGFDVFSIDVSPTDGTLAERCLTDGISVNFNAQFVDDDGVLVYISERTGAPRIFLKRSDADQQFCVHGSLFHDRPVVKNGKIYFVSAHEEPPRSFQSWAAVYSLSLKKGAEAVRLTPDGGVDYSPAVSQSGKYIAVASYGTSRWGGEFHDLETDIVVFPESDPSKRVLVCCSGGWPTWSGDSTVFFHRQSEDGWWSIFVVEFPQKSLHRVPVSPRRVTPPGLHCFTPAAFHDGKRIAVATRRKESSFRHVEIFDLDSNSFSPLTEPINPSLHHYNPFVSSDSSSVGYHRFRGESGQGERIVPNLETISSPIRELRLVRINGSFPAFSSSGDLIAYNHDFEENSGVKIVKSNGSKRWTLLQNRTAFHNCWSPTEDGVNRVIYTSLGPIFAHSKKEVQVARISFDGSKLDQDVKLEAEVKILTKEDTGNNAFPACSPDGKWIVFRSGRSGYKNLYIMDAVHGEFEGGSIRRLTTGPWFDTMPAWSPDGELIVFSSNRHDPTNPEVFGLYMIKPDGTGLRRVCVAGDEGSEETSKERLNHASFSPDGKWLLFTANVSGITAEPVSLPNQFQPYGELYVKRIEGGERRRLTFNPYENGTPTWHAPSGEFCVSSLTLQCEDGDVLKGQFNEPFWLASHHGPVF